MNDIKISEINIIPIKPQNGLIGFASCVINNALYIGDIAVYTSFNTHGYRLVFPDKILNNGKKIQCVHPINSKTTDIFTKAIVNKLENVTEKVRIKNDTRKNFLSI